MRDVLDDVRDRFWSKVNLNGPNGCWEWVGGREKSGYGSFHIDGGMRKAHRVSWILTNGPIPFSEGHHGTCVLHRCDNPCCVNPHHLFLGTNRDNMLDMVSKGRGNKISGEQHHNTKLSAEQVKEIREKYAAGLGSHRKLAKEYGVVKSQIGKIVNYQQRCK